MRSQLLQAEAKHFAGNTSAVRSTGQEVEHQHVSRGALAADSKSPTTAGEDDPDMGRRKVLEVTRDIDAESDRSQSDSSEERCAIEITRVLSKLLTRASDGEDETAELMRELERIKKERAEQRVREVRDADAKRTIFVAN